MHDLSGTLFALSGVLAPVAIPLVIFGGLAVFKDDQPDALPVTATPIERICEGGHWL